MGHCIQAIVCQQGVGLPTKRQRTWPEPIALAQGYTLVPMFESVLDAVPHEDGAQKFEGFTYLTHGLLTFLTELSEKSPLAYLETDYFGGEGGQAALAAREGRVVVAPTNADDAINQALAAIGVRRLSSSDEFEALNLGAFRRMDAFKEFEQFS